MAKAISVIDDVFDSKTLSRIYNTNKIKYNPKDYSFKDKLLAIDLKSGFKHIANINYNAECTLLNVLEDNDYKISNMEWKREKYNPSVRMLNMVLNYPRVISGTPCFVKMGDLYFKPEGFLRYENLTANSVPVNHPTVLQKPKLKEFETDDIFNAVLQLHIALTANDSIAKYLIWQTTEFETFVLEDICNLDMLTRMLKAKEIKNVHAWLEDSTMFAPVAAASCSTTDNFGTVGCSVSTRNDEIIQMLRTTYTKCILYGLEVLHALYTIRNPKYVAILEELLLRNAGRLEEFLYSSVGGKFTLNPDVEDIVNCHKPEERYAKISKFMCDYDIWAYAQTLTTTDPKISAVPVAEWLLETCAFCNEYAVWDMRVKYISILYKHCKDSGYLNPNDDDEKDIENTADLMTNIYSEASALGMTHGDLDGTSLMDIEEPHAPTKMSAPPSGPTAEVSPTVEALDKLKASYRDDKYSFEVRDIIDTNSNDTYTTIAEHSALLNKSLIKRIKEIKVYNTGGKNAGLSKGKLDRKALHRYKTCKDIFYNNTYKVKESDLAFGLILDVSGSMAGNGIKNGVATMIILHETLKALNINHSIITHTSDGRYHSEIDRYQAFKEDKTYSTLKNYALSGISAHCGNCDSGALFYMEKALLRVKNKDKICIMFSDGEPTECTGTDLKEQVAKMERQGIKVIGVGINYDNIKKYYNEYANGKNLNEMFDIVAGILKRYVLEKED